MKIIQTSALKMKDDIMFKAFFNMERGDLLDMAEKESKIIKEANENYNILTGDAELKRLEEIRMFAYMEEQAALSTAKEEGKKEGEKEEQLKVAKKLLDKNLDIKEISEITELTIEEIKRIKKDK